jgi:hypothetical protein
MARNRFLDRYHAVTLSKFAAMRRASSRVSRLVAAACCALKRLGRRRMTAYFRSTNSTRHSPGPIFSAVCDCVIGTASAVPALLMKSRVVPSGWCSRMAQSVRV